MDWIWLSFSLKPFKNSNFAQRNFHAIYEHILKASQHFRENVNLYEKCPNTDQKKLRNSVFGHYSRISPCSVRMRENTDQKKLFMQCVNIEIIYLSDQELFLWDLILTISEKLLKKRCCYKIFHDIIVATQIYIFWLATFFGYLKNIMRRTHITFTKKIRFSKNKFQGKNILKSFISVLFFKTFRGTLVKVRPSKISVRYQMHIAAVVWFENYTVIRKNLISKYLIGGSLTI